MKGCFYLQRRFAYIGHALAVELQQRHGMTSACGMVALRPSMAFLQNQTDLAYSALLLEEDLYAAAANETIDLLYLEALERRIGAPNLWAHITPDRVICSGQLVRAYPYDQSSYTHEDMLRIVQSCAKRIDAFLEQERPDFVLFSIAGNIASLLLYRLARARGIRTLFIDCARMGNGYFLTDQQDASPLLWETWQRLQKAETPEEQNAVEDARHWLKAHREHPRYYLASSASTGAFQAIRTSGVHRLLHPGHLWRALRWTAKEVTDYIRDPHRGDYDRIHPGWNLWDKARRYVRLLRSNEDLFEQPREGEAHAYFALHSEPESYPAVLAPFYTDQVWLARQIARSLPVGWKLYVKDHPVMRGLRTRAYYKALRRIPNVRLIHPHVSGLTLAQHARMTLTITGTAAWEALLLGRPAVIFGNMFYQPLSGVARCTEIETLPALIRAHAEQFQDQPQELAAFIAALQHESVDVDLVHLWDVKGGSDTEANRQHVAPLAARIARTLQRPASPARSL